MTKKVLLFCDPGIDDTFAIMYVLLHPELELVGIVTSYGNVSRAQATANAAYLLQLSGKSHIPVIPGAAKPVQCKEPTYSPDIHGYGGIGPIRPPSTMTFPIYPFDTIRVLTECHKENLIIVDIGRSTALAIAFILYEEQMKRVGSFYIMGGALFIPGNVTPVAEANFFGDPSSSNFVLTTAHNLTIIPLDASNHAYFTPELVDALAQNAHNPLAFLIKPIYDYYFKAYQRRTPGLPGAPIHDLVTLMAIANPQIANYIYYEASVIEYTGEAKGMCYNHPRPKSHKENTRIAINLNHWAFIGEVEKILL
ncbi:nucleoside hydrolase [Shouchella shacheensis]|uniref:nucleoside hydrolase n=1 Tax=Shouchella shacheensis TaxID=1649580 RepID=UPI00073FBF45|nr:nucleoside hydrolase [Shouchella shacheensis]